MGRRQGGCSRRRPPSRPGRRTSWEACQSVSHPALTAAQALDESSDRERRLGPCRRIRRSHGRPARSARRCSGRPCDRDREHKEGRAHPRLQRVEVLDYHGDWPTLVREITGGGAPRPSTLPPAGGHHVKGVADSGRLATITGDPPREERGIAVADVYVRPDRRQLSTLAELLRPRHPERADRVRPSARSSGTSAATRRSRGADGADRPVTPDPSLGPRWPLRVEEARCEKEAERRMSYDQQGVMTARSPARDPHRRTRYDGAHARS